MSNNQFYSITIRGLVCPFCGNSFSYDMNENIMTCCGGEDCLFFNRYFVIPKLPLIEVPEVNEWHKRRLVDKSG